MESQDRKATNRKEIKKSENKKNINEPQKLSEEELAGISGGAGSWSSSMEADYQQAYSELGGTGPFRDWMLQWCDEDIMEARDAWLAANKPTGTMLYLDDGTTRLV